MLTFSCGIRYANKPHICGLPSSRFCFIRRAASFGAYLPSHIALNSTRLSAGGRSRCQLVYRGVFPSPPPRWLTISDSGRICQLGRIHRQLFGVSVLVQWQTYAFPFWIRFPARPYRRSKLSLEYVTFIGVKPSRRTVSSVESSYFFFSPAGFVAFKRR